MMFQKAGHEEHKSNTKTTALITQRSKECKAYKKYTKQNFVFVVYSLWPLCSSKQYNAYTLRLVPYTFHLNIIISVYQIHY